MKKVYRITLGTRAITLERWPDWAAFDANPPERATGRADIAYSAALPGDVTHSQDGLHEIQHLRINNGRGAEVDAFLASDLAAWKAAGADALGAFTVVHGSAIPAGMILLRWPSLQAALVGQTSFESDRIAQTARHAARRARNQAPIRSTERQFRQRLTFIPMARH